MFLQLRVFKLHLFRLHYAIIYFIIKFISRSRHLKTPEVTVGSFQSSAEPVVTASTLLLYVKAIPLSTFEL